ncbi:MAG: hypothetical protein WC325_05785 [Candidatus Bathyarchaeia archaeon]|jgi:hypothetical protein
MNRVMKRFFVAVVLVCFCSLFLQLPIVFAADEKPIADRGLAFIKDVAMMDVTKYDVKISGPSVDYLPSRGGIKTETLRYDLKSSESELHLFIIFTNGNLQCFRVYNDKGSPVYKQTPSTILNEAKETLERFQNVSKVMYPPEITNLLHAVNSNATECTLTSNNVKLAASIQGNGGALNWFYVANGIEYTRKSVRMTFSNGRLTFFGNDWNVYSVGNTNLNVTKQEAIETSIQRAQSHKLVFDDKPEPFILAQDKVNIQLWAVEREPLTLQLTWHVKIPFVQPVYGVYGLEVGLWADTGESFSFGVLSAAGMPSEPSWTPPPPSSSDDLVTDPPTQTENNENSGSESSPQTSDNQPSTEDEPTKPIPDFTTFLVVFAVAVLVILGTIVGSNRRNRTAINHSKQTFMLETYIYLNANSRLFFTTLLIP